MQTNGEGLGVLVPTGKSQPVRNVRYEISHVAASSRIPGGELINRNQAVVHFITCGDGGPIPLGDFDLVVGRELLRLKHMSSAPEWLVLSSNG